MIVAIWLVFVAQVFVCGLCLYSSQCSIFVGGFKCVLLMILALLMIGAVRTTNAPLTMILGVGPTMPAALGITVAPMWMMIPVPPTIPIRNKDGGYNLPSTIRV